MASSRVSIVTSFLLLALCGLPGARAQAGDIEEMQTVSSPFERGGLELQLAAGFFVSENYHDPLRPQMNDVDASVRLGWMLYSPAGPSILRGNVEVVAELFGGGFVRGPADLLGGTTIFIRYNYVQPAARFVPYIQVGGGGAYSDASQKQPQRALGSAVSFNLQVGLGVRFFCSDKSAVFLEFDYRHLSNAGLAERNLGLNSGGSWLGASLFF